TRASGICCAAGLPRISLRRQHQPNWPLEPPIDVARSDWTCLSDAMTASAQDKQQEIAFFDAHAGADAYDVFTAEANARMINAFVKLSGLGAGARVADLGCGSGAFTHLLDRADYNCIGLDLSAKLLAIGRRKYPQLLFIAGDIEQLPFADASLDGILLSGVVHHLPDPSRCAAEVFRVLRPGGRFVAFDPNLLNPFMC